MEPGDGPTARSDDAAEHWRRGGPCSVVFSPDGSKVATSSLDGSRLWDAVTGRPLGELMKHGRRRGSVGAVAFSPDGAKIATAEGDDGGRLWDAMTGKPLGLPMRHDTAVNAVAFSPDGTKLLTTCDDGVAGLWDLAAIGARRAAKARRQGRCRGLQPGRIESRHGQR